jgi:signal transduction histidine kinase
MDDQSDIASRRILSVTEEELSRIVLDIHDGPVQYLFAALSLVTKLQNELDALPEAAPADMRPTLGRVSELVEASLHEIKAFLGTFRPPEFNRRSLRSIIEGLVIQHEEWTNQSIDLRFKRLPDSVALPVKIALYRILQEALANSYRHAQVPQLSVVVWEEDSYICLEVKDQGRGFDPPPLAGPQGTEREEHIGLRGMRDRVALLEGVFELESHPGRGTRITVKFPAHV